MTGLLSLLIVASLVSLTVAGFYDGVLLRSEVSGGISWSSASSNVNAQWIPIQGTKPCIGAFATDANRLACLGANGLTIYTFTLNAALASGSPSPTIHTYSLTLPPTASISSNSELLYWNNVPWSTGAVYDFFCIFSAPSLYCGSYNGYNRIDLLTSPGYTGITAITYSREKPQIFAMRSPRDCPHCAPITTATLFNDIYATRDSQTGPIPASPKPAQADPTANPPSPPPPEAPTVPQSSPTPPAPSQAPTELATARPPEAPAAANDTCPDPAPDFGSFKCSNGTWVCAKSISERNVTFTGKAKVGGSLIITNETIFRGLGSSVSVGECYNVDGIILLDLTDEELQDLESKNVTSLHLINGIACPENATAATFEIMVRAPHDTCSSLKIKATIDAHGLVAIFSVNSIKCKIWWISLGSACGFVFITAAIVGLIFTFNTTCRNHIRPFSK